MTSAFSDRLKELREGKGLSQRQLASQIEVNVASICRWEKGTQSITAECIIALAEFFGVTTDFLLGISDK